MVGPQVDQMELRDWLAGQAIVGLLQSFDPKQHDHHVTFDVMAEESYYIADAILQVRMATRVDAMIGPLPGPDSDAAS